MPAVFRFSLVLLAVLAVQGCDRTPQKSDAESRPRTAVAERRDIAEDIHLTGDIAPAYQVDIKPEVGGRVREVNVVIGQQVKEGDLLFVIDDRDLQIERSSAVVDIEGAQVTVEKLASNLGRARELYSSRLISKEVFENLEADHRLAENALQRARRKLETVEDRIRKTRVLAPADGTILTVPVIAGQVVVAAMSVNAGTTLATLADLSKLLIDAHVNQLDIAKISKGGTVEVLAGTERATAGTGKITFIAPLASTKNNVKGFSIQAMIEGDTSAFRPGMSVGIRLPVSKADNAVAVPVAAVFDSPEGKVVYVDRDGKVERRAVEVGTADLFFAEIRSGVSPGDRVLLTEPRETGAKPGGSNS